MIQTKQIKFESPTWDAAISRKQTGSIGEQSFGDLFDTARLQQSHGDTAADSISAYHRRERTETIEEQPRYSKDAKDDRTESDIDGIESDNAAAIAAEPLVSSDMPADDQPEERPGDTSTVENSNSQPCESDDASKPTGAGVTAGESQDVAIAQGQSELEVIQPPVDTISPEAQHHVNALQNNSNPAEPIQANSTVSVSAECQQEQPDMAGEQNTGSSDKCVQTLLQGITDEPADAAEDSVAKTHLKDADIDVHVENSPSPSLQDSIKSSPIKENMVPNENPSDQPQQHDRNDSPNQRAATEPMDLAVEQNQSPQSRQTTDADLSSANPSRAQQAAENKKTTKTERTDSELIVPAKAGNLTDTESTQTLKTRTSTVLHTTTELPANKLHTIRSEDLAPKTDTTALADAKENIDRVVKAASAAVQRGSARVQIRLEPPELGVLRIDIRQNAQGMQLQLQVSNTRAQHLLQQNANELRSALESQGVNTTQIDIQLRLDLRNESTASQRDGSDQPSGNGQDGNGQSFDSMFSQQDGRETFDRQDFNADFDLSETESTTLTESPSDVTDRQWQELRFTKVNVIA